VSLAYRVFHQFKQAKFANNCSILSLSQFLLLPPLLQKKGSLIQRGQNRLKRNYLASKDLNPKNSNKDHLLHTDQLVKEPLPIYNTLFPMLQII
jgi:hypothetical protein